MCTLISADFIFVKESFGGSGNSEQFEADSKMDEMRIMCLEGLVMYL